MTSNTWQTLCDTDLFIRAETVSRSPNNQNQTETRVSPRQSWITLQWLFISEHQRLLVRLVFSHVSVSLQLTGRLHSQIHTWLTSSSLSNLPEIKVVSVLERLFSTTEKIIRRVPTENYDFTLQTSTSKTFHRLCNTQVVVLTWFLAHDSDLSRSLSLCSRNTCSMQDLCFQRLRIVVVWFHAVRGSGWFTNIVLWPFKNVSWAPSESVNSVTHR